MKDKSTNDDLLTMFDASPGYFFYMMQNSF